MPLHPSHRSYASHTSHCHRRPPQISSPQPLQLATAVGAEGCSAWYSSMVVECLARRRVSNWYWLPWARGGVGHGAERGVGTCRCCGVKEWGGGDQGHAGMEAHMLADA